MKKFGLIVAILSPFVTGAFAHEASVALRTMKLTTGKIVSTLQFPASQLSDGAKRTYRAKSVRVLKDKLVLSGDAALDSGRGLKVSADRITLVTGDKKGKNVTSLFLTGKVVVRYKREGREEIRFSGDKAELVPQQGR